MTFRPVFPVALALSAIAATLPASATEVRPFDARKFAEAQAAGKTILVDVYADWCPVCRAQHEELGRIYRDKAFDRLVVFKLNFDQQVDDWKRLGARSQSTLILYKGRKEISRSVAITDGDQLDRMLRAGL